MLPLYALTLVVAGLVTAQDLWNEAVPEVEVQGGVWDSLARAKQLLKQTYQQPPPPPNEYGNHDGKYVDVDASDSDTDDGNYKRSLLQVRATPEDEPVGAQLTIELNNPFKGVLLNPWLIQEPQESDDEGWESEEEEITSPSVSRKGQGQEQGQGKKRFSFHIQQTPHQPEASVPLEMFESTEFHFGINLDIGKEKDCGPCKWFWFFLIEEEHPSGSVAPPLALTAAIKAQSMRQTHPPEPLPGLKNPPDGGAVSTGAESSSSSAELTRPEVVVVVTKAKPSTVPTSDAHNASRSGSTTSCVSNTPIKELSPPQPQRFQQYGPGEKTTSGANIFKPYEWFQALLMAACTVVVLHV